MPRPIHAVVHQAALTQNLERAKAMVQASNPRAKAWAVVKADAYGHGIERVYAAFEKAADGFALLDLEEAERVRDLGWGGPVLLLEGIFEPRDINICERQVLTFTVHCDEQIDMLAHYQGWMEFSVFLKMNSGMNRLGFTPAQYRSAYERLHAMKQVGSITHMTHFSDADGPRGIAYQMEVFNRTISGLPGARSVSNSGAVCNFAAEHSDWVRPGIMLYGSSPMGFSPAGSSPSAKELGLKPTMSLRTRVIGVQQLQAGSTVGYGSSFTATEPMRIGIVACGYADGYMRLTPTGTPVLVDGIRTRTVGRVSMDMITVDLTPCPSAHFGSAVEMWGEQLPIDEVAAASGTVAYELMCGLTQRVPLRVE
jgi:alanine racemase